MSINLAPFYQAVDQYQLDRWLPLGTCALLFVVGLMLIALSATNKKDSPLSVLVGLLGSLLVPMLPLSLMALHHVRGEQWHSRLVQLTNAQPIHWYLTIALCSCVLVSLLLAGGRKRNQDGLASVFLGLLVAIIGGLLVVFAYLLAYYWSLTWAKHLEYAVPVAASVLVALSTLGYAIRRKMPHAKGLNFGYQIVIGLLLAALSFGSVGHYFGWGAWRYGAFVNSYEFYHYYIGAKYSPEVGYFHMYDAALVADVETGKKFSKTQIRDLTTTAKIDIGKVMEKRDEYRALFSDARWQEFLMDMRWFKEKLAPPRFSDMLGDKGYNATPVWTMLVGGILSENISTTDPAPAIVEYPMRAYRATLAWIFGGEVYPNEPNGMLFLALIDIILIAAATGCVVWAFGVRAAMFMLILLGTSYVMKFSHMKGAYLRTDFTMALIIGICMLKKQQFAAAGSFIAYSCLSRVFPAVFFFGMGAKLAWHAIGALPLFFRKTGAAGAAVAVVAAGLGGVAGALLVGPKVLERVTAPKAPAVGFDIPNLLELFLRIGVTVAGAAGLVLCIVILWGWYTRNVPRRYFSFFTSATATTVILVGASFLYHSAVKPAHHPLNYKDKIGEEGTFTRSVGNFLSRNFDGGLTVFGEYAHKIGRHNTEISPWRVGFKYWFIGVGSKRPLWAGWVRAEKGESGWVNGQPKDENAGFWSGLAAEIAGPTDEVRSSPEFEKFRNSGSFERIRYRDPGTPFWGNLYKEFKENAVVTRSAIHKSDKNGLYTLILLMVLGLSFFLVAGFKDHEATAWSFVLVFFLVSATYYYFILLLVPLLFFSPHISRPTRALGIILLLMAAWPGYYMNYIMGWKQSFSTYYYHSVMYFIITLYMMAIGGGASLRTWGRAFARWRAKPKLAA